MDIVPWFGFSEHVQLSIYITLYIPNSLYKEVQQPPLVVTIPIKHIYSTTQNTIPFSNPHYPSTMKFTITTLAIPLLAAAAPITEPAANPAFSVMAIRSASPIHYLQLNAAGQKFYLGGKTASYCPTQVPQCPPGNQTVFAPGGSSLVSRNSHYPSYSHPAMDNPR